MSRLFTVLILTLVLIAGSLFATSHSQGQTIPQGAVYLPLIARSAPTPTVTSTSTPQPTATNVPANTATPRPTATTTNTPQPTATTGLLYICDHDAYNCSNFNTQAAAQAVFDYCVDRGFGDIHRLDFDGNGVACESLP